ncbi:MAG: class I SAM-dependent rRNA methyltransferase [bacterium]
MAKVILKGGRKHRAEEGHPWIFANEVESIDGDYRNGDIVSVVNSKRKFVGRGYINDRSQIIVRLLTRQDEGIDGDFFRRLILRAWEYRERVVRDTTAYRLLHAEADGIPALIADRFGDYIVLQFLALGVELWRDVIVEILVELLKPRGIYERSDVPMRRLEGLEERKGELWGECPSRVEIEEGGARFWVDFREGQKTGFFLDQRENRLAAGPLAEGREVLNAFSYTGGFGVHAMRCGAKSVLNVDISEDAIALARENFALNGFREGWEVEVGNSFDALRRFDREGRRFDMVILDPPAFVKNRRSLGEAMRGYKEINLRAMRILNPGGILVTCSCSHHLKREEFRDILRSASQDAGREARLIEERGQARDHPVLLNVEETEYLKCSIIEVP